MPFAELLLPELEAELKRTRRILAAVPEGHNDFKPHSKSATLSKLAGHTAELPGFASMILTAPDIDMASPGNPRKPIVMESTEQLLAAFDHTAGMAIDALKAATDASLESPWKLSRGEMTIFSGTRYEAYRTFGLNHLVHHRAQLGTYIRLLEQTLPGTYGPSADGM